MIPTRWSGLMVTWECLSDRTACSATVVPSRTTGLCDPDSLRAVHARGRRDHGTFASSPEDGGFSLRVLRGGPQLRDLGAGNVVGGDYGQWRQFPGLSLSGVLLRLEHGLLGQRFDSDRGGRVGNCRQEDQPAGTSDRGADAGRPVEGPAAPGSVRLAAVAWQRRH